MKNGKPNDWEARLAKLEADVSEMKALLQAQQQHRGWRAVIGAFGDDPDFLEILRLGNEEREKERRKVRRQPEKIKGK